MALSEKVISWVNNLSFEDAIELLHECADERLGIVSIEEYKEIFKVPKRTIYDHIKKGKIHTETIANKICIIINDNS